MAREANHCPKVCAAKAGIARSLAMPAANLASAAGPGVRVTQLTRLGANEASRAQRWIQPML
ncbi:hypothetical protein D3C83_11470 [compost metagenome]